MDKVAVLMAALAAVSPADPPREPREDDLVQAYRSKDPGALALEGATLNAAGLAVRLRDPDRELRAAAVMAAPHAGDAHGLLLPLAQTAAGGDRALALSAARGALRIAARLDRERALDLDLPDDELAASLAAWRDIGADPARWADVRVLALELGRRLHDALGADAAPEDVPFDIAARLADADPQIRRAALELLPRGAVDAAALAGHLADPDADVALAAAQALCGPLAVGGSPAKARDALGADGLARLRELVAGDRGSEAARADARRCLKK